MLLDEHQEALLRDRIVEYDVDVVGEEIVELAQPAAYMVTDEPDDYSEIGNTRLGGVPDLPIGAEFPSTPDGLMLFVAQINLEKLPYIHQNPLPDYGMLYFFHSGMESRFDLHSILYFDGDFNDLERAPNYAVSEFDEGEDFTILNPYRVQMATGITLPPYESIDYFLLTEKVESLGLDSYEWSDRYFNLTDSLQGFEVRFDSELSHILGYSSSIGRDPAYEAQKIRQGMRVFDENEPDLSQVKKWHLLLEVGSNMDVGMQWSDAGFLQFVIHDDDLGQLDFRHTYSSVESG